MTYAEYTDLHHQLVDRSFRLSEQLRRRARAIAAQAGLDPNIAYPQAQRAMVYRECGEPMAGVDYALVQKVLCLQKRTWDAEARVSAILRRAWSTVESS